jgi:hypothetical protein
MRSISLALLVLALTLNAGASNVAMAVPLASADTQPVTKVSGQIVNDAGEPISSAVVTITVSGTSRVQLTSRTDSVGNYAVTVPVGVEASSIRVIAVGYVPVTASLVVANGVYATPKVRMRAVSLENVLLSQR